MIRLQQKNAFERGRRAQYIAVGDLVLGVGKVEFDIVRVGQNVRVGDLARGQDIALFFGFPSGFFDLAIGVRGIPKQVFRFHLRHIALRMGRWRVLDGDE